MIAGGTPAARAVAFRHAVHARVCDRAEPWAHGTVVAASAFPTYHTYNSVRVEDDGAGLTAAALVVAADRLQVDVAHRQIEVEDVAAGERLRPGFAALGWVVERLVWMGLEGPAPVDPAASAAASSPPEVSEVPFPETRALRDAWFGDDDVFLREPAARRRFLLVEEGVAARRGTRALVAWGPAGEPIGFAAFSTVGTAAEVEQVYVDPSRRGEGIGGSLVRAAVAAAHARRTWIVADDEGAPKRLYARLGFAPAWIQHVFTRAPA